jgi:hypothetical protein
MDTHLRGYYHVNNTGQFDIDASLFRSVVESVEPELAQFLFVRYSFMISCTMNNDIPAE